MNAQFTKDQTAAIRTLLSMFHPDKCPAEFKEIADNFTKAINSAKDKGNYTVIASIMALVAKYGITKDTKDGMAPAWDEFNTQPKTDGPKAESKAGPKAKKSKEHTIDPEIMAKAQAKQAESDWDRSKMGSWLNLVYDLKGAAAKVYLDELFKTTSSGPRQSAFGDFLNILRNGPMSDEAWEDWLKGTTENNRNHSSQFRAIKDTVNAVWAKK